MPKLSQSFYLEPHKHIRDLIHNYVNLSKFELKIIDTVSFQRLKDIRQLTCQEVYPSAQHTRFEHSLGVLELTKQAIKHLNKNGFIASQKTKEPIDESLSFNARMAALLHDVGHCPFSHLGEVEFSSEEVRVYLLDLLENHNQIKFSPALIRKIKKKNAKNIGSVHEQLSCIVILEEFFDLLSCLTETAKSEDDSCFIETDFELIIRCILGIEYDVSSYKQLQDNAAKNTVIQLINSKIFDMDKLDYIMRDSYFTGIGTPKIDTNRLFKNMYFNESYELVFTSRAVPALQNMIDSRDGLYMYVYNHHVVVLSDFIYTYIIRRFSRNAESFIELLYSALPEEDKSKLLNNLNIPSLGLIPKTYLFSVQSITGQKRTDSDWTSQLNMIYHNYRYDGDNLCDSLHSNYCQEIDKQSDLYNKTAANPINTADISEAEKEYLFAKIYRTFQLIDSYKTRDYLKPWWKTVFEFNNFLTFHFQDDNVKRKLCKWICAGGSNGLEAAEFRSQIAKHVIYITQRLYKKKTKEHKESKILTPLKEGDFFVVQRSNRFLSMDTIEQLNIALKTNDILDGFDQSVQRTSNFFIKNLTSIIPQKDYSAIYAKDGFYVFSRPLASESYTDAEKKRHYMLIEEMFVFVVEEFVNRGEQWFADIFCKKKPDKTEEVMEEIFTKFENRS